MDEKPAWAKRITIAREARGWNKPQFIDALRAQTPAELPSKASMLRRVHAWESGTSCPDDFYKPVIAKALGTIPATIWPRLPDMTVAERNLLAHMPLHAITTVHGEPGLHERLTIAIAGYPAEKRARIEAALDLASRLHADDRRQREPYLNHLLRVAIRISSHYRIHDADIICAALLHDAVEDHPDAIAPGGGHREALAVLASQFGTRVADLVAAVTNPVPEPGMDRHEQYRAHVIANLEASPWARVIKASDLTDNAVGLIHTTGPRISKLSRKYGPLLPTIRELILRPDTPLNQDAKTRIAAQLTAAITRLTAIGQPEDTGRKVGQP